VLRGYYFKGSSRECDKLLILGENKETNNRLMRGAQ
jgi:hypothetical protein